MTRGARLVLLSALSVTAALPACGGRTGTYDSDPDVFDPVANGAVLDAGDRAGLVCNTLVLGAHVPVAHVATPWVMPPVVGAQLPTGVFDLRAVTVYGAPPNATDARTAAVTWEVLPDGAWNVAVQEEQHAIQRSHWSAPLGPGATISTCGSVLGLADWPSARWSLTSDGFQAIEYDTRQTVAPGQSVPAVVEEFARR